MKRVLLPAFIVLLVLPAYADTSVGVIVYTEGNEITILRDGAQFRLDAGAGEALGEPLFAGDQVTTGEATFVELQLLTGRTIVRIAENTTFTVAEVAGDRSALSVTYGRLRARVELLAGSGAFEVRGLTATAGVRGTDFGYDQVLDPVAGTLLNRVSCFDGQVVVASSDRPELSTTIGEGEALLVPVGGGPQDAVVAPIPQQVVAFWEERPFVLDAVPLEQLLKEYLGLPERVAGEPTDTTGPEEPAPTAPRVSERETGEAAGGDGAARADAEDAERRANLARSLRTAGFVLTGVGVATDLAALGLFYFGDDLFPGWSASSNEVLRPVAIAGVGVLAAGLTAIVISIVVAP